MQTSNALGGSQHQLARLGQLLVRDDFAREL
jgi:hypothetical protein